MPSIYRYYIQNRKHPEATPERRSGLEGLQNRYRLGSRISHAERYGGDLQPGECACLAFAANDKWRWASLS